jgi:HlyD family secretion protein
VLTWVTPEEGATIHRGEIIARTADLNSFRVEATVSDIHATRIRVGLPVKVKVNEENYLQGSIIRILPTIENGVVNMEVSLEERSSPLLRSNLRVDVYVITARKENVLRIKKGLFINGGEGEHEVFVIHDDVALKTPVRIGMSSFEYYEVVEGLKEGDEVIISEMKDYVHLKEVKVRS